MFQIVMRAHCRPSSQRTLCGNVRPVVRSMLLPAPMTLTDNRTKCHSMKRIAKSYPPPKNLINVQRQWQHFLLEIVMWKATCAAWPTNHRAWTLFKQNLERRLCQQTPWGISQDKPSGKCVHFTFSCFADMDKTQLLSISLGFTLKLMAIFNRLWKKKFSAIYLVR